MNDKEMRERGIDGDFYAALKHHPQEGWTLDDVERVIAQRPGEHDGANYHWIATLKDGRYLYFHGGCDYTGWD